MAGDFNLSKAKKSVQPITKYLSKCIMGKSVDIKEMWTTLLPRDSSARLDRQCKSGLTKGPSLSISYLGTLTAF